MKPGYKNNYESPKFEFESLMLTERVADKCWGYAYAWFDADKDGAIDGLEKVHLGSLDGLGQNGCQGDGARTALLDYFRQHFPEATLTEKDVSTNVNRQHSDLIPSWS